MQHGRRNESEQSINPLHIEASTRNAEDAALGSVAESGVDGKTKGKDRGRWRFRGTAKKQQDGRVMEKEFADGDHGEEFSNPLQQDRPPSPASPSGTNEMDGFDNV